MRALRVTNGVWWVEEPAADIRVLCGCPADAVKHLLLQGLIASTERSGVRFETGPNAILLSDLPIQGGSFANLAEFPVLQMLYRQGMILPGHPNNDGRRPMLIGLKDQISAQASYIFRGNYGLASGEELRAAGLPEERAREMLRWKLRFAFDRILDTRELLDLRVVGGGPLEIRPGVLLERRGLNCYAFSSRGETVEIDLNLGPGEDYEPPYRLESRSLRREFFSVVHTGEGNGWDPRRPCMASLLCHQGRFYLIDAGPGILHTLNALGITVNEIRGIFHTHVHDDHFAGLTALARADHRLAYYAAPMVRAGVEHKLCSLMEMDIARFADSFAVVDLALDTWTSVEGLEVMPVAAPHPVDTTILFFRALGPSGYRTYAHLADIPALSVLDGMVTADPLQSGVTRAFHDAFRETLRTAADVKKVDVGGGPIHGDAEDFAGDPSGRLVLSHTDVPLTSRQLAIGVQAGFGEADVLIKSENDAYTVERALFYLRAYFPEVAEYELAVFASSPTIQFPAGTEMIRVGTVSEDVYFILGGLVASRSAEGALVRRLSAGALIGEITAISGEAALLTHTAASDVTALRIPLSICQELIRRNGLAEAMLNLRERRQFLEGTWLFGEMISFHVLHRLARVLERREAGAGVEPLLDGNLALLCEGRVTLASGTGTVEELAPGSFWGEGDLLCRPTPVRARTATPVSYFLVPAKEITAIPIVSMKLIETCDRRRKHGNAGVLRC